MSDAMGFFETAASPAEYFYVTDVRINSCRSHFHNNAEIVFAESDGFFIAVNGEEYILNTGDICFINGFDVHYFPHQDLLTRVTIIGESYCGHFYRAAGGKVFPTVMRADAKALGEITPLLELMHAQGNNASELMKYGFADMLFGIFSKYYPLVERKFRANTTLIIEILRYIEKNLTQEITLKGIAEKFGYSKTYLSALFNEYLGAHFRDYINRARVMLALDKLADKEKNSETVLSIAGKCGFDSPNTFYRAMKKYAPKNHNF